jgi:EAL domain-containing protein (putative c-di-GMP-specific phosphodiesterase class I)
MIDKCFEFIKKTDTLCSINFDMEDIVNEEVYDKLKNHLKEVNKPVVFEILETESFEDYKTLKEFVAEFRKYGVMFAIDDFGSGFSNYKEILELKPEYIKIDGSLITNILESQETMVLVNSIASFATMLNIKVVAEFVENEEIFKRLKALGVDEFQGYYFAKPTPLEQI